MGESIDVSPDDASLAFSYYTNGNESLYIGDIETGEVEQAAVSDDGNDHRQPLFSPDGKSLLYLAADDEGVQRLHHLSDTDSEESVVLSEADMHVFDMVMTPDQEKVYYIAMPREDFLAPEGEMEHGRDLHVVNIEGSQHEKLTDKDEFDMSGLNISDDGSTLFYKSFYNDGLSAYDIEEGTESTILRGELPNDFYQPDFSPDEETLAYTAVDEKSEQGTFLYELFLMGVESGDVERLTDYNASVTSPAFFHEEERIAFLAQGNWPGEPAEYEIMTVSYDGGDMAPLEMRLPEAENSFQPGAVVDGMVNPATLTVLYLLVFGLSVVYCHPVGTTYRPVLISAAIMGSAGVATVIASFSNPWMGIALGMITIWLAVCTILLLIFTFIYSKFSKVEY